MTFPSRWIAIPAIGFLLTSRLLPASTVLSFCFRRILTASPVGCTSLALPRVLLWRTTAETPLSAMLFVCKSLAFP